MAKRNRTSTLPSLRTQSNLLILVIFIIAFQTIFLASKVHIESSTEGQFSAPKAVLASDGSSSSYDPHSIGHILPDGKVTFTPEEFREGRPERYVNLPNVPVDPDRDASVRKLMREPVPPPAETLLHEAPAPPGSNAILGLASYPRFMDGWRKLVGSLRVNGYDGHIIVGVNPAIPPEERDYLSRMGVTFYAVEANNCSASIMDGALDTENSVRAKCSRGMENLKLEWGRFEMARRWLRACVTCSGWSMVIDTRDIFFQADPFASLGDPNAAAQNLLFVEEIAQYTNTLPESPHRAVNLGQSVRYKIHVHPCYGKENVKLHELLERPMLCSGTVIGTSEGMHRFLSVLVDEFRTNNKKGPQCRSPSTTDQWTMNYLYYRGRFGLHHKTKTLAWGTGPVLTVGKPCVNSDMKADGTSQMDLMAFDENGLVLNPHESEESVARVAPVLHQWDRCRKWIRPWFDKHRQLFMKADRPEDEPAMEWVK